jgi:hypothetical protein
MKTKMFPALALCSMIALTAIGANSTHAQQSVTVAPSQTFTLHAVYTKNEVLLYKMSMNMKTDVTNENGVSVLPNGPMATQSTANIRMNTTDVKPDGSARMVVQTTGMKMILNGQEMMAPDPPIITMEVNKYGMAKMSGMENNNTPGMQMMMKMMNFQNLPTMAALLPKVPVKVGDTWTNVIPSPMDKTVNLTVNSKLLGVETINGQETLKISQSFTMPMNMMIGKDGPTQDPASAMMTMKGSLTADSIDYILPSNARLIKMETKMSGAMNMNMQNMPNANANAPKNMNINITGDVHMNLSKTDIATPTQNGN